MSFLNRNSHDYDRQLLVNDNKLLVETLQQKSRDLKAVEEMNVKLAERVKQQSDGMLLMVKDHDKYIQYCVNNFNKQIVEVNEKCFDWRLKAANLEASLNEANAEIIKLKRIMIQEASQLKVNDRLKKRSRDLSSTESGASLDSIKDKKRVCPVAVTSASKKPAMKNAKSHELKGNNKKVESMSDSDEVSWTADEDSESSEESSQDSDSVSEGDVTVRTRLGKPLLLWNDKMDKSLLNAVDKFGTDWGKVAKELGFATKEQCRRHWRYVGDGGKEKEKKKTTTKKKSKATGQAGRHESDDVSSVSDSDSEASKKDVPFLYWNVSTDKLLRKAVSKHGNNWDKVAEEVGVATKTQCARRWKRLKQHTSSASKPNYNRAQNSAYYNNTTTNGKTETKSEYKPEKSKTGRYSNREDDIILSAVATRGSKDPSLWSDLAAIFGRSESSVEQRWMALCDQE